MNVMKRKKSRHKETSLIFSFLAIVILFFFGKTNDLLVIVLVNIISLIAILFSAFSVVRHADVLAHRLGEPYGSLVLSLSVVILEVSLISALMATGGAAPELMRDTLYSVIMIVITGLVGISLLLGGYWFATQYVNLVGIKQYLIAIIPLAMLVLVFPSTLPEENFSVVQVIIFAAVSAIMYGVFLVIQTHTHKDLFIYEYDMDNASQHDITSKYSTTSHGIWLVIHLIAVITVTKMNAITLESLLTVLNAPKQITGFLIALLILSPEGVGAIKAVLLNQVQRAMNIFFGSVLATISLTVPVVAIISLITGQTIIFGLDVPHIMILSTALLLSHISFSSGRTNVLNGASLLAIFVGYLVTLSL
ncbi:sodium-potassium/proton antiporter ChaA [Morganella morganii]|uniref:sodium-potassium/proton antiporter ChaA n=1 Tax=Morganella morganii TaxID=582 RepID=UPI0032DA0C86